MSKHTVESDRHSSSCWVGSLFSRKTDVGSTPACVYAEQEENGSKDFHHTRNLRPTAFCVSAKFDTARCDRGLRTVCPYLADLRNFANKRAAHRPFEETPERCSTTFNN